MSRTVKLSKEEVYYNMLLIRKMEQKIEDLFSKGLLRGTTHCCIGQEAVPVALSELVDIDEDYLCSGHRAHGLSIALSGKPEMLIGEIMGKPFGFAKGLGGSQHVYYKNYYTNGITGGMVPVAAGVAFALKHNGGDAISVVDFGDGAMNEGYVLESFNLAASMNLPLLMVLENNGYAMSTPIEIANPYINFEDRVKGFALPYSSVEASDYDNLYNTLKIAVDYVREKRMPYFVEVFTHRFCGHSKSDKRAYIPTERDDYWHEHDCLMSVSRLLPDEAVDKIDSEVEKRVEEVYQYCVNN